MGAITIQVAQTWHWIAIAAVAQVLAAGGTVFLAFKTAKLAAETRGVATKTGDEAKAAAESVKATQQLAEEARHDRELLYRPILTTKVHSGNHANGRYIEQVDIVNIGNGPALDCVYVTNSDGDWSFLGSKRGSFSVAGRSNSGERRTTPSTDPLPNEVLMHPDASGSPEYWTHALICSDQFGNRYRFGMIPPQMVRQSESDKPPWATWKPPE